MNAKYIAPCIALLLVACSGSTPPAASPPQAQTPAPAPTTPPSVAAQKSPERGMIQIAEEIRKACAISDQDSYFAFDSSKLEGDDRGVLKRVAVCFASGPLAGRSMRLVGNADPRGTEEYNIVLGGVRADTVKDFLRGEGVRDNRMATTSRGELDAHGTDEASWAKDRRVDVMLAN
ncbi:MAG TPA: OmpA family protein [Polyangiaceae bacterium]